MHRDAGFFEGEMHTLARGRSQPFHQGDKVELPHMQVIVTEITADGRPVRTWREQDAIASNSSAGASGHQKQHPGVASGHAVGWRPPPCN